jgi:hypothetical protein
MFELVLYFVICCVVLFLFSVHLGKCTENKNKGTKEQSTIPVQTLRQMYRKQKQAEITKEQSTTPVQTVR